jgi:hypothetical protein
MAETWRILAAEIENDASLLSALSELEFAGSVASYELPSAMNLYACLSNAGLRHEYQGSLLEIPLAA